MTLSPDASVRAAIRWVERTRQEVGTEPFDDHRDLWTVALVDALTAARRDAAACEVRAHELRTAMERAAARDQVTQGGAAFFVPRYSAEVMIEMLRAALAATPPPAPLIELTVAAACCEHHGERCGYCFNCPDLPGAATLAGANRLIAPCDADDMPAPLPAEDAGRELRAAAIAYVAVRDSLGFAPDDYEECEPAVRAFGRLRGAVVDALGAARERSESVPDAGRETGGER